MRWKWGGPTSCMAAGTAILILCLTIGHCDGTRRSAQQRKDTLSRKELYLPAPSAESIQALAQAVGAAGFEARTEGKMLVKRLIPADRQPDVDVVEHQGIIGKAGVDFPAFPNIPNTGFNCKNVPTGYYADLETDCQVFHICDTSRKISFLCPNGTIFSQSHLICDWWFKVDCASAPALYESSAEYYSSEQKKSQKVTQVLSKNSDLQQLGADTNIRPETRKAPVHVPNTTERLLRHRQRLQNDASNLKATSRSFQSLFPDNNYNPTQRSLATVTYDKKRKNLVQLIANNFGNVSPRTTVPTYTDASTYRTTEPTSDVREMQIAAESASFANNNNRQYLQDLNNKNYRPYPVYTPNLTNHPNKLKNKPTLTTLYDIRDQQGRGIQDATTKRPTLVPYTKSYANAANSKREPYTRPGVSLLKDFLDRERNKSLTSTTEKFSQATERSDVFESKGNFENKITIDTKNNRFESVTKIPQTTKSSNSNLNDAASSNRFDVFSNTNPVNLITSEPSYQERRERLMRKLNINKYGPTEPTLTSTVTEKYYGDLPNRPGLVVPPSLTPKTLHTLAIYYATALDNLSTTAAPEETETSTPAFDEYEITDYSLPALFSHHTINKYSKLFSQGADNAELLEEIKLDPNGTYNELAEDLSVQQSQNPLATSPQIRELAQVFTHALSAYLQDPVQFRKVLSDIRPTQPSFGDMLTTTEDPLNTEPTTTVNEDDDEILGFSDDNKTRPALTSLRDPKALNLVVGTEYPINNNEKTTTAKPVNSETVFTTSQTTTSWSPFRCCGRISAAYTSASVPKDTSTTPIPFSNTVASGVNTLAYNDSNTNYDVQNNFTSKYGGFQNNTTFSSFYGKGVNPIDSKPLSEYVEVTNLPTAWGIDSADTTSGVLTNGHTNIFESKKIRTTTSLPPTTAVYFTETDSGEIENEEELQRAHSQSFVTPQNNNIRQGKQINYKESNTIKRPSEELEAPTLPDIETTTIHTTTQPTTTIKIEQADALTTTMSLSGNVFTSPDNIQSTNQFQWPSTFESWQSTVIDPITLNDNLTPEQEPQPVSQRQTYNWSPQPTLPPDYSGTKEPSFSSSDTVAFTTPTLNSNNYDERIGKYLRDPTSTEPAQDITTIADTVVQKAKEIMGGMNATTTEKLMNVMKKTKSKTVRRLILLLVQTCDDDHNTTAEASKKALLEALMAVSQKDMDEIAREEEVKETPTTTVEYDTTQYPEINRRMDRVAENKEIKPRQTDRRGKSLGFDPSAINSLTNPLSSGSVKTHTAPISVETASTTLSPRTTPNIRRGAKKFLVRTSPAELTTTKAPTADIPKAEARVAPQGADSKVAADTRALELLRSLYTIAARWG